MRLRHREREPARFEQLDALIAQSCSVHRVLRVEAVRLHELGTVDVLLPTRTEQTLLLSAEVAEITASGALRQQRRAQVAELAADGPLLDDQLLRNEQQQQ